MRPDHKALFLGGGVPWGRVGPPSWSPLLLVQPLGSGLHHTGNLMQVEMANVQSEYIQATVWYGITQIVLHILQSEFLSISMRGLCCRCCRVVVVVVVVVGGGGGGGGGGGVVLVVPVESGYQPHRPRGTSRKCSFRCRWSSSMRRWCSCVLPRCFRASSSNTCAFRMHSIMYKSIYIYYM